MSSIVTPTTTVPAGASAAGRIARYLRALNQSHVDVPLNTLGLVVMILLAMAAACYGSQAFLAIATNRHLYGDGSWFLVKMLSENHVAVWNVHGWRDFFVGRFGAFAYQEYPTLLAARLHVHNPKLLSAIYGITLFSFKPISILLCYRFARDKRLVIFPVITLFAATMNSEVYLITETHLMTALFWPALFGLLYRRKFGRFDLVAMAVLSAPLLVCYETMAVFGLFLCAACIYRYIAVAEDGREKWLSLLLLGWYGLGVLFGAIAIVFPRDPANRNGFLKSMLFVFHNDHIGARVSCIVLLLCALLVLIPERYRRALNATVAVAALCSLAIPGYILLYPAATNFGTHVLARTMNASVPLLLAAVFVALHFHLFQIGAAKYKRLFVIAAVLGICQSCWSMVASTQWSNMLMVLRSELRTHSGPTSLQDSALLQMTIDGQPIRALHADWPLISLSILYSDHRTVQTLLLPRAGGFKPFNPYNPAALPNLKRFGFSYEPYLAALKPTRPYEIGEWISFAGEEGGASELSGWWDRESWGTWANDDAKIALNLTREVTADLLLQVRAGAFVNAKNPDVEVAVLVNDMPAGNWNFHYKPHAPAYEKHELPISKEALNRSLPPVIEFRISGAHSPAELGLGDDPRKLGLGLVEMRLARRPADSPAN